MWEQLQKCAAALYARGVIGMRRIWNIFFSIYRIYTAIGEERGRRRGEYIENEELIKKQFSTASALRVRSERTTLVFRHAFRFRGNRKQCNCPPLLIPSLPRCQSRKRIFLFVHVDIEYKRARARVYVCINSTIARFNLARVVKISRYVAKVIRSISCRYFLRFVDIYSFSLSVCLALSLFCSSLFFFLLV